MGSGSKFRLHGTMAWQPVVWSLLALAAILVCNARLSAQDANNAATTGDRPAAKNFPERGLDEEWHTFQPKGADAKFEMPAKPRLIERSFTPVDFEPAIKVHLYIASIGKGAATFIFGWHDLHTPPRDPQHRAEILNGAVRGSIANVLGTLGSQENATLQGNGGRKYSYLFTRESEIYKVAAEVYLVGERQYQLSMIAKQNEFDVDAAARFAASVRLLDPEGDLPPRPRKKEN